MEPRSPSKSKIPITGFIHTRRVLKIGITLFVIVVLLLFICAYIMNYVSHGSYFTIVLDCGSSGTRVNVYKWRKGVTFSNRDLPILLHSYPDNLTRSYYSSGCLYHCIQTEPGLDKFVGNASGVRESLVPLIRLAERWVPLERHGETPIFVLATAGLRRLLMNDAKQVMKDVEDVVKGHGFMFRKDWIRVLSGKEEAYYGWVALNYQMGIFGNSSRLLSFGLLDLGGSSLQVVTETDESRGDEHVLRTRIGSFEHWILAYSLPTFGLNEAFDTTIVMLSHTQALRETTGGSLEVSHPCLSSGFAQNYTCRGCFRQNSTDVHVSRANEVNPVILVGEPNWEQCKGLARAAAINSSSSNWSHLANDSSCTSLSINKGKDILNLVLANYSSARFHALSGFFAVYNVLNLSSRANLTKIWEKGQQLCARSWAGLTNASRNQNYAEQYCFRVPYMASLVEDALCLGGREIIFGPGDVSWTLGAALMEGKHLWQSSTNVPSGVLSFGNSRIIWSPLLLFVVLVCLLFIVYYSQVKLPMPGRKIAAVGSSLPSYIRPRRQPA